MSVSTTARLLQQASLQYGVVAVYQGRSFASKEQLRREFSSERWTRQFRGVFLAAGAPRSSDSRAMARLLRAGPGAVVGDVSALDLWGVVRNKIDPLHTIRMRASNGVQLRSDGIVAHETRRMPPHHVTVHRAFGIVTPSRALADAAARVTGGRLERWLDEAWSMRLVTHQSLSTVVADLYKRGRKGIPLLASLLRARGPDYVAPASGLESRLNWILDNAELPPVRRQVNIGGEEWLGRVDFRLGESALIIEAQSDRYHAAFTSRADDERRFQAFAQAGFRVIPLWESEIWSNPEAVVAAVTTAMKGHHR